MLEVDSLAKLNDLRETIIEIPRQRPQICFRIIKFKVIVFMIKKEGGEKE